MFVIRSIGTYFRYNKEMSAYSFFYIARHGQAEGNVQHIIMGQGNNMPLTAIGREQAQVLSQNFKDIHFDKIFSSDLLRDKETAEIIALEKKLAVETTHLLREKSYGEYEGKPYEAMDAYDALYDALEHREKMAFSKHGVESDEKTVQRLQRFIRETAIIYPEKTSLIVCHGSIMHAFLVHIGYGTYDNFPHSSINNTAYFKLKTDGVDFFIEETKGIIQPIT
jgi:broad specificity phosphatase PhoE